MEERIHFLPITTVLLFLLFLTEKASGQIHESELKKDLWKNIKPEDKNRKTDKRVAIPLPDDSLFRKANTASDPFNKMPVVESFLNQEYKKKLTFKATLIDMEKDKLKDSAKIAEFKANIKDLKFAHKHPKPLPFIDRYQTARTGSGFTVNISRGGRKKLSKKTKQILRDVYGVSEAELKGK